MFYKLTLNADLVIIITETVIEKGLDTNFIKFIDFNEENQIKLKQRKGILRFINNEVIDDLDYIEINIKDEKSRRVDFLKNELQKTDYKVVKCYEAFMRQLPLPYNLEELSTQRDAWRAEINQLEEELNAL
jgi:hypothetical protein